MNHQCYRWFVFSTFVILGILALATPSQAADPWVVYDGYDGPGKGKHIVLISGDHDYRSEEALPQLGKILAVHHGFKCTVLFAVNPTSGEIDPTTRNNIPGLEALKTADLMIIFTRFRDLPDQQMRHVAEYVEAGKPIIGMRTATHAFEIPPGKTYAKYSFDSQEWDGGFGRQILGETWVSHQGEHGKESTRGVIAKDAEDHPIVRGCEGIWGPTDVYKVRLPLPGDSRPLVLGQMLTGMNPTDKAIDGPKNDPMMPIAWVKTYKGVRGQTGRVLVTTMGASKDLLSEGLRRLLVNAAYWCVGLEDKIPARTNVDLVGQYNPSPFSIFGTFKAGVKPSDYALEAAEETVLPKGSAPAALASRHFPGRQYDFVWRNWNAVEPAKLAKILDTSVENVNSLAASMGLPPTAMVSSDMKTRGYITLIRRNWHLLPYEQLLELLEMTPEQLAFTLREDDFLWIKLGSLKPKCEPLRWHLPDETARRRAAEIRQVVERDFVNEIRRPAEPRFDFVRQLSTPLPSCRPPKSDEDRADPLRLVYSYLAIYGDPLLNPQLDPYPDGLLERLSAVGINGVWLHVVLRDLAPGGTMFPEFGVDHERRLTNLRRLVERAKKYGVDVYLYMNEPRAMPAAFFENRPEMAGVREDAFTALCTSHPAVRQWMADALAYVFRQVPDLGGVYAITASENLTNCASHGAWSSCEHCKVRSDTDIIADVVATIQQGVHRGNPKANVIVSDWGWRGHGDARDIIARLPKSVMLVSVSEWDLPIERGGVETKVDEYSISAVGPGPRALQHWTAARQNGLKTAAEIQFNNTCEIASVPYLPVMNLVAEHIHNLAPVRLDGMFIGWTMGGYPSPNFQLVRQLSRAPTSDVDAALDALAQERFGSDGAPHARKAWTLFSEAFRQYPFHISVVYNSPVQCGPANPLYPAKTDYKATMWGIPYDDLDSWRGPYPPEVFTAQFEKMAKGFQEGLAELQAAVDQSPPDRRKETEADLRYARAAGLYFQSVANQSRFVMARDALAQAADALSPEDRRRLRADIRRLLESEIALARELHALVQEDSRIGFEPSCQYFYLPLDLVEKVVNCRWLLKQYQD